MLSTPRADEIATVSRVIIAETANRVIEKMPIVLGWSASETPAAGGRDSVAMFASVHGVRRAF